MPEFLEEIVLISGISALATTVRKVFSIGIVLGSGISALDATVRKESSIATDSIFAVCFVV